MEMKKTLYLITYYDKQQMLCSFNFKATTYDEAVLLAYQNGARAILNIREVR